MVKANVSKVENSGLSRGLTVLYAIAESKTPMRFADLQATLELPKATLHRILATLLQHGVVHLEESSQVYKVSYRLLELANIAWQQSDVRELAQQPMIDLAEVTNESVQLAVLVDTNAVYLSQIESQQSVRYTVSVGDKSPVYCSGVGKAMLSALPEAQRSELVEAIEFKRYTQQTITSPIKLLSELRNIQQRGYATDTEEHQHGVRCAAAPILDSFGMPVAAISVTAPTFRVTDTDIQDWGMRVKQAAEKISLRLQPETTLHLEVN